MSDRSTGSRGRVDYISASQRNVGREPGQPNLCPDQSATFKVISDGDQQENLTESRNRTEKQSESQYVRLTCRAMGSTQGARSVFVATLLIVIQN
ncbi:hypothetical protein EDD11_002154 [Mortierella claussenii]|nr:hypothetical protein EDD11_002154 [Mortierella claussenii]